MKIQRDQVIFNLFMNFNEGFYFKNTGCTLCIQKVFRYFKLLEFEP